VQANRSCLRPKKIESCCRTHKFWVQSLGPLSLRSWRQTQENWVLVQHHRYLGPTSVLISLGSSHIDGPISLWSCADPREMVRTHDPLHLGPEDEPITFGSGRWTSKLGRQPSQGVSWTWHLLYKHIKTIKNTFKKIKNNLKSTLKNNLNYINKHSLN
jgi:hypothetical protein